MTVTDRETRTACPGCSYENAAGTHSCGMCGELLRAAPQPGPMPQHSPPELAFDRDPVPARILGLSEAWCYVIGGALLAPILGLTPLLQYMGWFLCSLCHEMGHSTVALFFGMPAYPAIRIDGHAASIHQPQVMAIAVVVWAFVAWLAWLFRRNRAACVAFAALAAVYPLLAFTDVVELLHLVGGHLGELTFGTVFLWRALSGGFTHNPAERLLYGGLGWYLVGANVWLTGGLMFSPRMRAWYHESGSFGLTNDYIRVAEDVLQVPLPTVAGGMLVVSLLAPPVAWLIWRRRAD